MSKMEQKLLIIVALILGTSGGVVAACKRGATGTKPAVAAKRPTIAQQAPSSATTKSTETAAKEWFAKNLPIIYDIIKQNVFVEQTTTNRPLETEITKMLALRLQKAATSARQAPQAAIEPTGVFKFQWIRTNLPTIFALLAPHLMPSPSGEPTAVVKTIATEMKWIYDNIAPTLPAQQDTINKRSLADPVTEQPAKRTAVATAAPPLIPTTTTTVAKTAQTTAPQSTIPAKASLAPSQATATTLPTTATEPQTMVGFLIASKQKAITKSMKRQQELERQARALEEEIKKEKAEQSRQEEGIRSVKNNKELEDALEKPFLEQSIRDMLTTETSPTTTKLVYKLLKKRTYKGTPHVTWLDLIKMSNHAPYDRFLGSEENKQEVALFIKNRIKTELLYMLRGKPTLILPALKEFADHYPAFMDYSPEQFIKLFEKPWKTLHKDDTPQQAAALQQELGKIKLLMFRNLEGRQEQERAAERLAHELIAEKILTPTTALEYIIGQEHFIELALHLLEQIPVGTPINGEPLYIAVSKIRNGLMRAKLSKKVVERGGEDLARPAANGLTSLMVQVQWDTTKDGKAMINYLNTYLEAGGDINAQDNKGNTALMLMAQRIMPQCAYWDKAHSWPEIILHYIDKGADINIRNNEGKRAVDFLPKNIESMGDESHQEAKSLLLYGAP